ncbi:MAG: pyruvate carboxylase, partial [Planctomycetota bacterium]
QKQIRTNGYAIQCRVTTENPARQFLPDYGRVTNYRSTGGPGIRLDAGSAYTGAMITPFYDSLLVKVTTRAPEFKDATRRMLRSLQEFRVRGVQTNIPFLINLVGHPDLQNGECTTRFIDETPSLFELPIRQDRASKLLKYVAETIVNGHPELKGKDKRNEGGSGEPVLPRPVLAGTPTPKGTRDKFLELGADGFSQWLRAEKRLYITDTTFRDAHQSLLATRLRTRDMVRIAPHYAHRHSDFFSIEMWGGATFDTSMRFLKECPWDRLTAMRKAIPNILFQMLLRSASAVGYTNYPDNAVHAFVKEAAAAGIDILRVFDANNGIDNLTLAIEAVRRTNSICEAAICYTGDITDPSKTKYKLGYYVDLARELARRGAHILAIKDMAGLCKPLAARELVKAIRDAVDLPLHFHTHDCPGGQMASLMLAADAGVDVVDTAMAPMAGMTSQVSLHALVEAMRGHPRDPGINRRHLQETADYWEKTRAMYRVFETGQLAPGSDVYENEMPGGQYTNLFHQAAALGLSSRWREACQMYAAVNTMFGDIVKVTPTSKVVGDMALFMVGNNLSPGDVLSNKRDLSFPESVVEFFEGRLGEPPGGFPQPLREIILKGRKPLAGRAGALLPPIDWDAEKAACEKDAGTSCSHRDTLSYVMYPKVFPSLARHKTEYSDTSVLPTPVFFHGLKPGEEASIDIERGKTLIVRFLTVGDPQPGGTRTVFFELNGQPREIVVSDLSLAGKAATRIKASPGNDKEIGAPMPGSISRILVGKGETVAQGQKLFTLEAMKMETTVASPNSGKILEILTPAGTQVDGGDLVLRMA